MSNHRPQVVFFGTGPVSAATLAGLLGSMEIEFIVTKPRMTAPNGRPIPHPVLDFAEEHKLPVLSVSNKTELGEVFKAQAHTSQVGLVVDFGIIIPSSVIDSFPLGILNSHFSLLPLLRGADPITAAILSGQAETGVSLMRIVPALDEGSLLCQEHFSIAPHMTTPELTQALIALSNKVIQSTLAPYINGSVKPYSQDVNIAPTYTHKLQKADGNIDWTQTATQIERHVRAYAGWPGSHTTLAGRDVIITSCQVINAPAAIQSPGDHWKTDDGQLAVTCGSDTILVIDNLKPAGRNEMTGSAFLAGLR